MGYVSRFIYVDLIQNQTLSNVHRLQHLQLSCNGKASEIISGIDVTEANFYVAWDEGAVRERTVADLQAARATYKAAGHEERRRVGTGAAAGRDEPASAIAEGVASGHRSLERLKH